MPQSLEWDYKSKKVQFSTFVPRIDTVKLDLSGHSKKEKRLTIKINLLILLKEPSIEKALLTLHATTETHFYFGKPKRYHACSCQYVCDALTFLLDNIFIRFGTKLYSQVVGIQMGTNCAPLVADLFLFCYERDFMMSLSDDKQANIVDAFNTTSRYLDDTLNIDNVYFDNMVSQIYPSELQLNKANTSDTEAAFLDLYCQFLMIFFLPKFMINVTTLILKLSISLF